MTSRHLPFLFLVSLQITSICSLPKEPRDVARITTIPPAKISAEVAKYTSYTEQYFTVAASSQLAAMNSYEAAEDSLYSLWVSETSTLAASESAALASEYAAFTSQGAIWATYTGTGDPFASSTSVPTSSAYVVPAAAAAAPSSTDWPVLPQVKAPAPYGIQCQVVPAPGDTIFVLEYCADTITKICQHIQMSNDENSNQYFHDRWVWNNKGGLGCAMGYWMPWSIVGTDKVPTTDECQQTIYTAMTNTCFPNDDSAFNTASVNLKVLPTEMQTGEQVDSGSLSYMIAPHPPDCDAQFPYPCKASILQ